MERVVALGDWAGFPARRAEARARGKYRGIGVSNYVDTATGTPRERAEITVLPDGVVEVVVGTVSNGQGHETSFAQLIGEWLGVPIDSVRLVTGDTDRVSVGGGSHSGRALRLASIVMLNASRDIIAKGLQIASHILEAAPADLEFADGRFRVKGTDRTLGIFEVAAEALRRNDLPEELRGPLAGESDETNNLASFPYGCHVCEVEVDPETGVAEIVRYTAVDDVGRAVNPLIVHGQIHGGITHGLGQALSEYCVYDRETGQLLSGSLLDYALPRADRLPFFATELSEIPTPKSPARHSPCRRRRHDPGARRRDQCDCRCARRIRRDPHRDAGNSRTRLACDTPARLIWIGQNGFVTVAGDGPQQIAPRAVASSAPRAAGLSKPGSSARGSHSSTTVPSPSLLWICTAPPD